MIEFFSLPEEERLAAPANALCDPPNIRFRKLSGRGRYPRHCPTAVPANDADPAAPGKRAAWLDSVFWLDLVEIDGLVLLASRLDCGLEVFRAMRRESGARAAQLSINTVHLDELFDVEKFSEKTLTSFGSVVCNCLRLRAEREFPDHTFVAELTKTDEGDRVGIRLYQRGAARGETEPGDDASVF